ncbi:hypothetical protein INR49_012558 [Caranx melampygus]|nr:hypothetical protein INR49_012558 [Caranx melampygus]
MHTGKDRSPHCVTSLTGPRCSEKIEKGVDTQSLMSLTEPSPCFHMSSEIRKGKQNDHRNQNVKHLIHIRSNFKLQDHAFSTSLMTEKNAPIDQIQLGTLEMRPWRSKQASAHCFGGSKGRPTLCCFGPSGGRLDLLRGRDGTKDIQQFNHGKSTTAIPDTKHEFFKARSTDVANIILCSFKAASICIVQLRTQLSQVRAIFGVYLLICMWVVSEQTLWCNLQSSAFVFLHT